MMENEEINVIITKTHTAGILNIVLNRLFVALIIFVLGCSRDIPADPDILYTETKPSAAACLIKSNVQLLVVKNHDTKGWDLPTHKQQNLISAQCTAHQAVWGTTGLNVEVGKLLFTAPDETQYFECKLTDDFSRQLQAFPVPAWAQRKTSEISLINPFSTEQDHWVNDINLIILREAYNQLE
jgi:hypothetical protein